MKEIEADQVGLAAGRDPDADVAVILKLGVYRKMELVTCPQSGVPDRG